MYETNYCDGLRILEISRVENSTDIDEVREVGFFDVDPERDDATFHGSWSSYPYFTSGTVVVSSIEKGLFVLKYEP